MYTDSTGYFAVSITLICVVAGAIIGATAGGVAAYNIAKNNGAEGWELAGWTAAGIVGGAVIGGALGYGAGALITHTTGVVGFSVTKYSIIPIKSTTVLGSMPGYISAAGATGSGYYLIDDELYYSMEFSEKLYNNMTYIQDAYSLGSQFSVVPDTVVYEGSFLWYEIMYMVEHYIPFIVH
jgi:hypothetical protein